LKVKIKFPKSLIYADDSEKMIVIDGFCKAIGYGLEKSTKTPGASENKIINELENAYYDQLWQRKKLNDGILKYIKDNRLLDKEITIREKERFRKFLADSFALPVAKINELVLKSFLVGAMVELGEKQVALNLTTLPATIKEAIKQGNITWEQARQIRMAQMMGAESITGISEAAQHRIRQMLLNGIAEKRGSLGFAQQLFAEFNDGSLLNRDMERIAITEMNAIANAGFISGVRAGEYVVGVSQPDACKWCLDHINGKIFKVIEEPPPEYANLNPASKKYQTIADVWDTCIWSTKTNIGRSASKNRMVGKDRVAREHHELASPGISAHPNCRCRYLKFYSEFMYVENDEVKYVSNDKEDKERLKWFEKHPELTG